MNLHAELDDKTEHIVAEMQRDSVASGEQLVIEIPVQPKEPRPLACRS
jgi:hypothetical protein